jgi:Mn-dependent DtxR family transcriptional regulator
MAGHNAHGDELKKGILKAAEKNGRIVTTTEIAKELNISWNTAEKALLEMTIEGKIERLKKAGVNLWVLK